MRPPVGAAGPAFFPGTRPPRDALAAGSQPEAFAAVAERLDAASARARRLATAATWPPRPEALAEAQGAARSLYDSADGLLLQFGPADLAGTALVVPRRSHAFAVARATACLPAYLPGVGARAAAAQVQVGVAPPPGAPGAGQSAPRQGVRSPAECAAMAMGLQLGAASVGAALQGFG